MNFRRPFSFESLESRQMLNAAPIDSAQLKDAEQQDTADQQQPSSGWIRYRDSSVVFEANGETKELTTTWPLESLRNEWQPLKVADFNGDGAEDILGVTPSGDPWLQIRDANIDDSFSAAPWGDRILPTHEVLGYGDVNNDSLLDVISVDRDNRELLVSINQGNTSANNGFSRQTWGSLPIGESQLFVGDFNGDSRTDVLVGSSTEKWLLAQSNGTSFDVQPWGGFPALDWQDVFVGNFDTSDGLDVAGLAPGNTWWVWSGTETGLQPANYWGHLKMVTDEWVDLRVEDLNADGQDDIIGRTDAGELWVSTAKSEGKFHPWRWADGWPETAQWKNVIVADAIGDSLPDYVGQATGGTWWVAENLGNRFINSYLGKLDAVDFAAQMSSTPPELHSDNPESEEPKKDNDDPVIETPPVVESPERLQILINDDHQIVLKGTGQLINGITLTSASGSLVWNDEHRGPLENAIEKSDFKVRLLSSDQPVEVNGEVIMGVAWQPSDAAFDLQVSYDSVQAATVIEPTRSVTEKPGEEPVVDEPTLETDETPVVDPPVDDPQNETPIPTEEKQGDENPVDGEPSDEVPVNGEVVTDEPIETIEEEPELDPGQEKPVDEEPSNELSDPGTNEDPEETADKEEPPKVVDEPIESPTEDQKEDDQPSNPIKIDMANLPFSLNEDDKFVIPPLEQPLLMLRLRASDGGLIPNDTTWPFDTYYAQSERHVLLGSNAGATWNEGDALNVAWNRFIDPHSLTIEFVTEESHEWQLLTATNENVEDPPVNASEVEPETQDPSEGTEDLVEETTDLPTILPFGSDENPLRVSVNEDSYLVLSADGINVPAVDFVSPAGGLVPGGSPQPFEFSVTSHPRQITLGTWGEFVAIDGSVTLDIRWNSEVNINDLSVEYGGAEAEALTAIIVLPTNDDDDDSPTLDIVVENIQPNEEPDG